MLEDAQICIYIMHLDRSTNNSFTMKQRWLDAALASGKAVNLMVLNLLNTTGAKYFPYRRACLAFYKWLLQFTHHLFHSLLLSATNDLFTQTDINFPRSLKRKTQNVYCREMQRYNYDYITSSVCKKTFSCAIFIRKFTCLSKYQSANTSHWEEGEMSCLGKSTFGLDFTVFKSRR